jgi:hypothetical protein
MDEIRRIAPPEKKQKKAWSKPKCISGKEFEFWGFSVANTSTGPNYTPS